MSNAIQLNTEPLEWITIGVDRNIGRLRHNLRRLRDSYPGRYEFRIVGCHDDKRYELSVRHRG